MGCVQPEGSGRGCNIPRSKSSDSRQQIIVPSRPRGSSTVIVPSRPQTAPDGQTAQNRPDGQPSTFTVPSRQPEPMPAPSTVVVPSRPQASSSTSIVPVRSGMTGGYSDSLAGVGTGLTGGAGSSGGDTVVAKPSQPFVTPNMPANPKVSDVVDVSRVSPLDTPIQPAPAKQPIGGLPVNLVPSVIATLPLNPQGQPVPVSVAQLPHTSSGASMGTPLSQASQSTALALNVSAVKPAGRVVQARGDMGVFGPAGAPMASSPDRASFGFCTLGFLHMPPAAQKQVFDALSAHVREMLGRIGDRVEKGEPNAAPTMASAVKQAGPAAQDEFKSAVQNVVAPEARREMAEAKASGTAPAGWASRAWHYAGRVVQAQGNLGVFGPAGAPKANALGMKGQAFEGQHVLNIPNGNDGGKGGARHGEFVSSVNQRQTFGFGDDGVRHGVPMGPSPEQAPHGWIRFSIAPGWRLYVSPFTGRGGGLTVDGREVPMPPQEAIPVSVGSHFVTIGGNGFDHGYGLSVDVRAGEIVDVRLLQNAAPVVAARQMVSAQALATRPAGAPMHATHEAVTCADAFRMLPRDAQLRIMSLPEAFKGEQGPTAMAQMLAVGAPGNPAAGFIAWLRTRYAPDSPVLATVCGIIDAEARAAGLAGFGPAGALQFAGGDGADAAWRWMAGQGYPGVTMSQMDSMRAVKSGNRDAFAYDSQGYAPFGRVVQARGDMGVFGPAGAVSALDGIDRDAANAVRREMADAQTRQMHASIGLRGYAPAGDIWSDLGASAGTALGGPGGGAAGAQAGTWLGSLVGGGSSTPTPRPGSLPPAGTDANKQRILQFLGITPTMPQDEVIRRLQTGIQQAWDPADTADARSILANIQSSPAPTPTPTPQPPAPPQTSDMVPSQDQPVAPPQDSSGLSTAEKVGIGLGAAAVVGVGAVLFSRSRKGK